MIIEHILETYLLHIFNSILERSKKKTVSIQQLRPTAVFTFPAVPRVSSLRTFSKHPLHFTLEPAIIISIISFCIHLITLLTYFIFS